MHAEAAPNEEEATTRIEEAGVDMAITNRHLNEGAITCIEVATEEKAEAEASLSAFFR